MFSTMKKQKKAEDLIDEAKRAVEEIDEKCDIELQRVEKLFSDTDTLKNHLARKTLKRFHDLYSTIKGVEPIEMADIPERPYSGHIHELTDRLKSVEPVTITGATRGKIPAALAAFTAALTTLIIAVVTAIVGTGTSFELQSLGSKEVIEKLLRWIGGGAFDYPSASPLLGGVALGVAAFAAALITWSVMMAKNSGKNLSKAQKCHTDAMSYKELKESYLNGMKSLEKELLEFRDILETFDIFMQEYNAIIRRIQYTEGRSYEEYSDKSKEVTKRAAVCAQALVPILSITVVASDGSPSGQLLDAIMEGKRYSEALTSQKPLPAELQARSKKEDGSQSESENENLSVTQQP